MSKLGQVFLNSSKILKYISSLVPRGRILEIGAGDGRLTKLLRNKGYLYAVEIDDRFKEILEKLADEVFIIDFLKLEPFEVDYIVGNVPYYISSKILFKLLDWRFKEAILMFQKEFVDKIRMKPGDPKYGRLSVTANYYFNIEFLKVVNKRYFRPVPKVDSAIIKIRKIRDKDNDFDELVRILFSYKNKKIKNIIPSLDIYRDERPDRLDINQILEIVKKLRKK